MLPKWNCDTDGNSATVRIVLFDFKKAFDLIDHDILIQKLVLYELPNNVVNWITDFLLNRKQRVKLCQDCVPEWGSVPIFSLDQRFKCLYNDVEICRRLKHLRNC
jgi:hypothetical protein